MKTKLGNMTLIADKKTVEREKRKMNGIEEPERACSVCGNEILLNNKFKCTCTERNEDCSWGVRSKNKPWWMGEFEKRLVVPTSQVNYYGWGMKVPSPDEIKYFISHVEQETLRRAAEREICICAAVIAEDGTIIRGQRHSDCIVALRDRKKNPKSDPEAQGFITSKGRYVTRVEGRKLQDIAGIKSADKEGYRGNTLFSEDLY